MADSSTNGSLIAVIVLLLVAILLAVTNPSEDAHREALSEEYARARPLAGAVGLGTLSASVPEYHSFVLGSYTSMGDGITSIGALGMVRTAEPAAP